MIRNLLALIGLAALALAAAVALQAYDAFDDDPPRVRVSYAGLDLATPTGIDLLERRVNAAVDEVCPSHSGSVLRGGRAERECRERAIAVASPQVDAAVARAVDRARRADYPPPPPAPPPPPPQYDPPLPPPPPPPLQLVRRTVTTTTTVTTTRPAPPPPARKVMMTRPVPRSDRRPRGHGNAYARRPAVSGSWLPANAWRAVERATASAFANRHLVRWMAPGREGYVTVSAARRINGCTCRNVRVVKYASARQLVVAEGLRCHAPGGGFRAPD